MIPAQVSPTENGGDLTMQQRLVIIGAGFAGMYAALSAARLRESKTISAEQFEIALVSPEPTLVVQEGKARVVRQRQTLVVHKLTFVVRNQKSDVVRN